MKQRPRNYYSDTQKALMWDRWQKGDSMHAIARLFDRGHGSVGNPPFITSLKSRDQAIRPRASSAVMPSVTLPKIMSMNVRLAYVWCNTRRRGTKAGPCIFTGLISVGIAISKHNALRACTVKCPGGNTLDRVSTEMSLHVLAYNMKRMMNIIGTKLLICTENCPRICIENCPTLRA
jgi:hypothetical protein